RYHEAHRAREQHVALRARDDVGELAGAHGHACRPRARTYRDVQLIIAAGRTLPQRGARAAPARLHHFRTRGVILEMRETSQIEARIANDTTAGVNERD